MNLIIAGCEYSGTTTLANGIAEWARSTMGGTQEIHDHFKIPHIACYRIGPPAEPLTDEELAQIMEWTPKMKEMAQRQSMNYHMPNTCAGDDYIVVGFHVEDAVYAAPFLATVTTRSHRGDCAGSMPGTSRRSSWSRRRIRCSSTSRPQQR